MARRVEKAIAQPLTQARVDLFQCVRTGTKRGFSERVQRRVHGIKVNVEVFRLGIDIEQTGDDLAFGRARLQIGHGGEPVMGIIVGGELAQQQLRSVMLLTTSTVPGA